MPADTVGWCLTKRYVCMRKRTEPRPQLRGFFSVALGRGGNGKIRPPTNSCVFEEAIG
jgi:hypothetical protein